MKAKLFSTLFNTLYIPHCRVFNHMQRDFATPAFLVTKQLTRIWLLLLRTGKWWTSHSILLALILSLIVSLKPALLKSLVITHNFMKSRSCDGLVQRALPSSSADISQVFTVNWFRWRIPDEPHFSPRATRPETTNRGEIGLGTRQPRAYLRLTSKTSLEEFFILIHQSENSKTCHHETI